MKSRTYNTRPVDISTMATTYSDGMSRSHVITPESVYLSMNPSIIIMCTSIANPISNLPHWDPIGLYQSPGGIGEKYTGLFRSSEPPLTIHVLSIMPLAHAALVPCHMVVGVVWWAGISTDFSFRLWFSHHAPWPLVALMCVISPN